MSSSDAAGWGIFSEKQPELAVTPGSNFGWPQGGRGCSAAHSARMLAPQPELATGATQVRLRRDSGAEHRDDELTELHLRAIRHHHPRARFDLDDIDTVSGDKHPIGRGEIVHPQGASIDFKQCVRL